MGFTGDERLLVDGELVPAKDGGTFATLNPATEEVLGVVADAGAADMDAAITAARRAFDATRWSTDLELRLRCVRQLHRALVGHLDELRELTIAEVGAPRFLLKGPQLEAPVADVGWVADLAESYEWKRDLGTAQPMGMPSHRYVLREPVGVVAAITPWNFPHQLHLSKIAPALAAGNTVVLKPAPDPPWCATVLGRIIAEETDIPAGVVNIVTSSDHSIGAQLAEDPRIDLITFTGSTATGRKIMHAAADNLSRVFLELGGKSALIVLDDADLASAASVGGFAACTHAGQGCAITTRLLLPRSRFDEGVEAAAATMLGLGIGDPEDEATVCGPVISAAQRERVENYLRIGKDEGGRFVCGGGRPIGRDKGFWVEPTLIDGITNDATVAQQEIFGPVLVAIPYDDDDDAVRLANDSPYGLSGAVYSGDLERAWSVARRVRTGTFGINEGQWYGGDVPFGGYKQSGIGREMGLAGFEEYLETKTVAEPA